MTDVTASCSQCHRLVPVVEIDDNWMLADHFLGDGSHCAGSRQMFGQAPEPPQAPKEVP
jgi:hypothetical protein